MALQRAPRVLIEVTSSNELNCTVLTAANLPQTTFTFDTDSAGQLATRAAGDTKAAALAAMRAPTPQSVAEAKASLRTENAAVEAPAPGSVAEDSAPLRTRSSGPAGPGIDEATPAGSPAECLGDCADPTWLLPLPPLVANRPSSRLALPPPKRMAALLQKVEGKAGASDPAASADRAACQSSLSSGALPKLADGVEQHFVGATSRMVRRGAAVHVVSL